MTKLLLPVKTGGLETPRREIDTCHTDTHTRTHSVCAGRIFTLGGGAAFMWEIRAQSRLKAVFSGLTAVSVPAPPHPPVPMCLYSAASSPSIDLSFFTSLFPHPRCVADIAQRYRITKYPTLKMFRNGMMMKREYRGQRSVAAIADFIRQQQVNPVKELQSVEEMNTLDVSGKPAH